MKKIYFLVIFNIFFVFGLNAQTKISTYQSSYFKELLDVEASQNKLDTSLYTYYINTSSMGSSRDKVCLMVESKELNDFHSFITKLKEIYTKWRETAKANNVNELDKEIEINPFKTSAAFMLGKWHFDFNARLTARAKILKTGMVVIVESGKLQSSSNQFIDHKGLVMVFESPEQIDEFITATNIKLAQKFFRKQAQTNDLFKN